MRFRVLYKRRAVGEVFTCNTDQWGWYHYKSDWEEEGYAGTTLYNTIEALLGIDLTPAMYPHIRLEPIPD